VEAGITITSIQATDPGNVNFSGIVPQANHSKGNYVKFSAIQANGFTHPGDPGHGLG
jgi:hypothetical protein